ncbi:hypothetical protein Tco_0625409 [Tanacetum coccineum]|uniref:Reverse transcriptase domain-containing protein n=1 Tax=Tanacetum coccineum TaxID=301880 RepID=A0ABQ4WGT0_9ASTR
MRTRSQARKRRQPQVRQTSVESSNLEKPDNPPIVTMADNRTQGAIASKHPRGNCINFDTFYNALNSNDQDSLNSAAGGNFLDKMPRECLKIIESKSKLLLPVLTLPVNTVYQPKEDIKRTRCSANNGSTEDVQPPVVQIQSRNPNPEPNVSPVPKASIPFPTRRNDERRKEKANEQIEKFNEIFKELNFEISFLDALTLMPKFASTLKTLIGNKEKLSEMAKLNETCSAVILNKLPKKLGDPGRFLIPCEFSGITHANGLGHSVQASILCRIPRVEGSLSFLSLPNMHDARASDRSITTPISIAQDAVCCGKVPIV